MYRIQTSKHIHAFYKHSSIKKWTPTLSDPSACTLSALKSNCHCSKLQSPYFSRYYAGSINHLRDEKIYRQKKPNRYKYDTSHPLLGPGNVLISSFQGNECMNLVFRSQSKRYIHLSTPHMSDEEFKVLDEKNKIEDYILHKRKKLEHEQKLKLAAQKFQEAFIFKVDKDLALTVDSLVEKKKDEGVAVKKPFSERIIDEIKHYYNGFRLLYLDTRIAARMLWQVLNGHTLSRRERKQFLRTAADLFRLVPFSVFLIVPFMEFLLPVAIKLFPNMLPSTFEDKDKKKARSVASLKMKLQMAEFLQDTIEQIAVTSKSSKPSDKLKEFSDFVTQIRTGGEQVSNKQIMKFSKFFEDEITLENIQYDQLKALCRLIMISPIGTPAYLRFKIRMKLQELKADDVMIQREGLDSLSIEELQNACVARGMRSLGVPVENLKSNLRQWLELSMNEAIPASLLLLSRTLFMSPHVTVDEQLKVAISQLPERIIDEMEVKIGAVEGESVDRQTIIDIIQHEEELIRAEKRSKEEELKLKEQATADELSKADILSVQGTLSSEREELTKIRGERGEYIEDVENLKQVATRKNIENIASSRLGKRIDSILDRIDKTLGDLEKDVSELPQGKIDLDEDGIVTTQELFEAIRQLRNAPDETKTQRLIEVLDEDKDGELDLEELRRAVKLLAEEDLELDHAQIVEVMGLLKGTQKVQLIEQMINKKKTNYIIQLFPRVYNRTRLPEP